MGVCIPTYTLNLYFGIFDVLQLLNWHLIQEDLNFSWSVYVKMSHSWWAAWRSFHASSGKGTCSEAGPSQLRALTGWVVATDEQTFLSLSWVVPLVETLSLGRGTEFWFHTIKIKRRFSSFFTDRKIAFLHVQLQASIKMPWRKIPTSALSILLPATQETPCLFPKITSVGP